MEYIVKIISIEELTHDVKCLRVQKPAHYSFIPGQATEVSINTDEWKIEKRPFTFTSLTTDPYLEFIIKSYRDHDGVTNQVDKLKAGDELIIGDPWGAIEYKGEGYFIAGGVGITPFIAILKRLYVEGKIGDCRLFFSSKTVSDIIYERELLEMLGNKALLLVTESKEGPYMHDFIDETFLKIHVKDFSKQFYICGPDQMTNSVRQILIDQGANPDTVIFEK